MAVEIRRVLSKHPSYKKEDVPCILIAGKAIAKKYGWKVGDQVKVSLEEYGVSIIKADPLSKDEVDEIQEDTTSLEEKEETLEKENDVKGDSSKTK